MRHHNYTITVYYTLDLNESTTGADASVVALKLYHMLSLQ